ncbi:hypothetical protein [Staphylococcus aureus]
MQRLTHIQNECADNDLLKLKGDFYGSPPNVVGI